MKHLKKDTGGYALLYVLVIVMVLAAISMMICTVALRNLQSQQAAVERMADKYAAQGEIEKIKAIAENFSALGLNTTDVYPDAETAYQNAVLGKTSSTLALEWKDGDLYANAKSTQGPIQVVAVLDVDLKHEDDMTTDPETNQTTKNGEKLLSVTIAFTSYAIETTGGDAG